MTIGLVMARPTAFETVSDSEAPLSFTVFLTVRVRPMCFVFIGSFGFASVMYAILGYKSWQVKNFF
jgi:nitrate reductase NapE component